MSEDADLPKALVKRLIKEKLAACDGGAGDDKRALQLNKVNHLDIARHIIKPMVLARYMSVRGPCASAAARNGALLATHGLTETLAWGSRATRSDLTQDTCAGHAAGAVGGLQDITYLTAATDAVLEQEPLT